MFNTFIRLSFLAFVFVLIGKFDASAQIDESNRYMLGQSFEQAGEQEKAEHVYEELCRLSPGNPIYFQSFMTVLFNQKKYAKAIQLLEQRLVQLPNDLNVIGMLGRAHYMKGDEKKAFTVWENFLKSNNSLQYYRAIANYAIEVRAFEKALEYLYGAKKIAGDKKSISYEIANLQCVMMNYKEAGNEFAEIILADPAQSPSVEGRMYAYFGRKEAVEGFLSSMAKYRNKDGNLDQLLARLYFENGKVEDAVAIYKRLDEVTSQQGNGLFNFAQQAFASGFTKEASGIYEYLLNKYPSGQLTPMVKLNYARTLEAGIIRDTALLTQEWKPYRIPRLIPVGGYRKVMELYQEIIKIFKHSEPAIEALLATGTIYYNAGMYDSARVVFEQVSTLYAMSRFSVQAQSRLAETAMNMNNLSKSLEWYDKVLQNPMVKPDELNAARYKKALILTFLSRFEEARALVGKTSELTADDNANDALELGVLLNTSMNDSILVTMYAEAMLKMHVGNLLEIDALFLKLAANKQQFYLKSIAELSRVEIFMAQDKFGEVIKLIDEINKQKSNIFEDKINFYLGLTYSYGLKDSKEALKAFETFLAEYPSSMYGDRVREEIKRLKNNS